MANSVMDVEDRAVIERVRAWRADVALALAGVLFGAATFSFRSDTIQGVHYYVGREWALRGSIPYRDTFDYKTPGIFAIHALLVRVFGEQMWSIRLAELGCVFVLGLLCAHLLGSRVRGATGLVCLTTFVVYYGYFYFWDTAQCEMWAVTFVLGALVAAPRRPVLAGVLVALALLMKPPAVLLAIPALRRAPRWLAGFALGLALPIASTATYFVWHGAGRAAADILFGANAQYVLGARRVDSLGETYEQVVDIVTWFHPFGALLLGGGLLVGVKAFVDQRCITWPRLPILVGVTALAAIVMQLKFYRYHYALMVPALVLGVAFAYKRWLPSRPFLAATIVVALWGISGSPCAILDDRTARRARIFERQRLA